MDMPLKTQSKFAEFEAIDHPNSEQDKTGSGDSQRESSKPSEISMYIEMGIALTAAFSSLAMAAWVWYLTNPDWISSIRRFQEMI